MKPVLTLLSSFIMLISALAQDHPDFTVTDSDGNEHKLYEDYLDQGKTVVIKIFFVDCPPCNAIAKDVQAIYEKWGEGQHDVQFFEMSTTSRDSDADINGYKSRHSITFPGVGNSGGGKAVVDLYKQGQFGLYYGTPSFSVIAPDKTVTYGTGNLDDLEANIRATGATGMEQEAENTTINVNIAWPKDFTPDMDSLSVSLQSADGGPSYDIVAITEESLSFGYPSDDIPLLENPQISIFYQDATSSANGLNGADVILMRKHILGIQEFETPELLAAADGNNDGKINGNDVVILRKVILGILPSFRNDVPSYFPKSSIQTFAPNPGNEVNVEFEMVKVGDFN